MQNLEAKFRLPDLQQARANAEALGFTFQGVLLQRDTFFVVRQGKLKLREQPDGASLIHYRRDRVGSLDLSHYEIVPVANSQAMLEILGNALGVLSQVRKQRVLLLRDNIRLHLDRVEGLGEFGEIEAVVEPGGSAEAYREKVSAILAALAVRDADLIDVSYFELMRSRQA